MYAITMNTTTRTEEQVAIRITDFNGDHHFYQNVGPDREPLTVETAKHWLPFYKPFHNATVVTRTVTITETVWEEV